MPDVQLINNLVRIDDHEYTVDEAKDIRKKLNSLLKDKKEKTVYSEDSFALRLAKAYYRIIKARNKEIKEPDYQKWAVSIDLMIRVDKRSPMDIYNKMISIQADPFWQNNVLSTDKLRQRWNEGKLDRLRKVDNEPLSVRFNNG